MMINPSPELLTNLIPMTGEIFLALATFGLLLYGVTFRPRATTGMLTATLIILALTLLLVSRYGTLSIIAMNGMFITDGFSAFVKCLLIISALLSLLIGSDWITEEGGRPFEFLLLTLLSLLGMLLMVSANSLLAVYMSLELSSLALYVLAAFNRDDTRSTESGLKYFVLGALASGMLLFGMSLVYGFTGALGFEELASYLTQYAEDAGNGQVPQALLIGLVLIIIGFCFKISAVPFHMWAPDVYEGAPTPVTAYFATASKIAAFAMFARVLTQPFGDLVSSWQQVVVAASFLSMAVGALAALRQTNIKRLLAYSSIGHAGFVLMGLAAGSTSGVQGMLVYLTLYAFMSAGAFGVVLLMRRKGEYIETISDFAGLSRTRPWLAFALAACMFSMAGIPPLAGFFGKMYVILPAIEAGLAPLAVMGLLTSVISCYYYLRVVKFMYFDEPVHAPDTHAHPFLRIGLAVSVAITVCYFLTPGPLINGARAAASLLLQ